MTKRIAARPLRPTALGTGLLALDVVCNLESDDPPHFLAGGTCGNVLIILAFLGWRSLPISRLAPGKPAERLEGDLRRWNVATSLVTTTHGGSTPIIFHRIGRRASGEPFHSFSWRCPDCGAHLPGYKPVLATQARELAARLPLAQVFFFDRVSRGVLHLATESAKRGAIVVFEPSGIGDPSLFQEAWSLSHIVKYSQERLREITDMGLKSSQRENVLLEIETWGAEGLRYRSRLPHCKTQGWLTRPAFKVESVKDAAGSGDWCTAAILSKLARGGLKGLRKTIDERLLLAIRHGQAWAAWNCGFAGARGGMYEVRFAAAEAQVKSILDSGEVLNNARDVRAAKEHPLHGHLCPACKKSNFTIHSDRKKVAVG